MYQTFEPPVSPIATKSTPAYEPFCPRLLVLHEGLANQCILSQVQASRREGVGSVEMRSSMAMMMSTVGVIALAAGSRDASVLLDALI